MIAVLLIVSLISCSEEVTADERIIVANVGSGSWDLSSSLAYLIADTHHIEPITELSSQIVLCTITGILDIRFNDFGDLIFDYETKIDNIYFDVSGNFKKDDIITITTSQGIMKGNDYSALIKNNARAQKFGDANKVYADNEYITASTYDGIPMEVGKQYIAYLTDDYAEEYNVYPEIGKMYLYEYTDGVLYQSINYDKLEITLDELKDQIYGDLKNRTGRADEIGTDAYIEELGEKQRMAKKESYYELIKTDTPMYTEGYFSWVILSQAEIFAVNDAAFEAEYINSEYYTLKYTHVDYFDSVPDYVAMENHYTILKFKMIKDHLGNMNYNDDDIIYVAQRNYRNLDGDDRKLMEFEPNNSYLIFAQDINNSLGEEIPTEMDFPASYITTSDQFVFNTGDEAGLQILELYTPNVIANTNIPMQILGDFKNEVIALINKSTTITAEHEDYQFFTNNKISEITEFYLPAIKIDGFELYRLLIDQWTFMFYYAPVEELENDYSFTFETGILLGINRPYIDLILQDALLYVESENSMRGCIGNTSFTLLVPDKLNNFDYLYELGLEIIETSELVVINK